MTKNKKILNFSIKKSDLLSDDENNSEEICKICGFDKYEAGHQDVKLREYHKFIPKNNHIQEQVKPITAVVRAKTKSEDTFEGDETSASSKCNPETAPENKKPEEKIEPKKSVVKCLSSGSNHIQENTSRMGINSEISASTDKRVPCSIQGGNSPENKEIIEKSGFFYNGI